MGGPRCFRRQAAFTLMELLVAMAVLGLLSMVAVPSFRDLIRRNQVSSASNAMVADLKYARAEAIARRAFVSVCPSIDGTSCAGSAAYENGWLVYAYPVGGAGADQAYSASDKTFNLLRYTSARQAVAMNAADAGVMTFGQQGQLKATTVRTMWICALSDAADRSSAVSTARVPGVAVTVNSSGSMQTGQVATGGDCGTS